MAPRLPSRQSSYCPLRTNLPVVCPSSGPRRLRPGSHSRRQLTSAHPLFSAGVAGVETFRGRHQPDAHGPWHFGRPSKWPAQWGTLLARTPPTGGGRTKESESAGSDCLAVSRWAIGTLCPVCASLIQVAGGTRWCNLICRGVLMNRLFRAPDAACGVRASPSGSASTGRGAFPPAVPTKQVLGRADAVLTRLPRLPNL